MSETPVEHRTAKPFTREHDLEHDSGGELAKTNSRFWFFSDRISGRQCTRRNKRRNMSLIFKGRRRYTHRQTKGCDGEHINAVEERCLQLPISEESERTL